MVKKERITTFRFTDSTYSRLKKLAESDEMTMTAVIERSIKNEYESRFGEESE